MGLGVGLGEEVAVSLGRGGEGLFEEGLGRGGLRIVDWPQDRKVSRGNREVDLGNRAVI